MIVTSQVTHLRLTLLYMTYSLGITRARVIPSSYMQKRRWHTSSHFHIIPRAPSCGRSSRLGRVRMASRGGVPAARMMQISIQSS